MMQANFRCVTCGAEMGERDAWKHKRQGHVIADTDARLRERIADYKRLAARAKAQRQLGAKVLFEQRAKELQAELGK